LNVFQLVVLDVLGAVDIGICGCLSVESLDDFIEPVDLLVFADDALDL